MKKILIIVLTLMIICFLYKEREDTVIIPDTAIRLRVIPNSNSSIDQRMKGKVKDYLESDIYMLLNNQNSIEEARDVIKENIPIIEENIDRIFKENSYELSYNINYGYNFFPEKEYAGYKYKEGYYESMVISIGDANGDNWWCVLFPNLCLVDLEKKENVEYKSWILEKINKIF